MKVRESRLPGVMTVEPRVFEDARGSFVEIWSERGWAAAGLPRGLPRLFVQDSLSFSRPGVLRGLHFQNPDPQGKLICVLRGEVFDVVVDVRVGSPTFGRWLGLTLSGDNRLQLYIPEGFAHGFVVTGDGADFFYKCTAPYNPQAEHTLAWNDPRLGIDWPVARPTLSEKDSRGNTLAELEALGVLPTVDA